jgi:hypothetical protein
MTDVTPNAAEAGLQLVKDMPNGTVFTADGSGRRLIGPQRLMRTGGVFHFVNEVGMSLHAYDIDLASIRDVVVPPGDEPMTAAAPADRLRWAQEYLAALDRVLAAAEADVLELGAQLVEAGKTFVVSDHPAWVRGRLLVGASRRHLHAELVALPRARRNHWAAVERRDRAAAAVLEAVPA